MNFYSFNLTNENSQFYLTNNHFDLIIVIPHTRHIKNIGSLLEIFMDFKKNYHPNHSILLLWMQREKVAGESQLEAFCEYFKEKNPFTPPLNNLALAEISFTGNKKSISDKFKLLFNAMKKLSFSYCMFYTPTEKSHHSSFKINLFFENTILNNSDLNLASYVIPFYKGMMINFWMMPIAYVFGRKLRNPSTPDFIFSKRCFDFWQRINIPTFQYLSTFYMYLTVSSLSSGIKISEFFLGEKDLDSIYGLGVIPELVHAGLFLLSKYKKFIKASTALVDTKNIAASTVPFNIYTTSDIEEVLNFYSYNKTFPLRKFLILAKRFLSDESYQKINSYFQHNFRSSKQIDTYGYTWNEILLTMIYEFLNANSKKKQKEIEGLFLLMFSFKPKIWADEISKMLVSTKEKARHDALRGFPWHGEDAGEYWHIHDIFEKKLKNDLINITEMKINYFWKQK